MGVASGAGEDQRHVVAAETERVVHGGPDLQRPRLVRRHVEVQTLTTPTTVINGLLTAQNLAWDPTGYLLGWNPVSWYVSTWALTPFSAVRWSDEDWPGHNWGGHNWGGGDWQGSSFGLTTGSRSYGVPTDGSIWLGAWG